MVKENLDRRLGAAAVRCARFNVVIARTLVAAMLVVGATNVHARAAQSGSQATLRWYDAYDQGVAAVQRRDWKVAEQRLNEARTANPKQGRNVLAYGDRYVTYLPDYYLGIVYLNTNRSRDAEAAFGRVSAQKLIAANNPEYKTFEQQSRQATFDRVVRRGRRSRREGELRAGE